MAEDFIYWQKRLRGLQDQQIIDLITEAVQRELPLKEQHQFIMDKYQILRAPANRQAEFMKKFDQKWNQAPEELIEPVEEGMPASSRPIHRAERAPIHPDEQEPAGDADEEMAAVEAEVAMEQPARKVEQKAPKVEQPVNGLVDDEIDELEEAELEMDDDDELSEEEEQDIKEKAKGEIEEIPYSNPELNDILESAMPQEPEPASTLPRPRIPLRRPMHPDDAEEMYTHRMSGERYERFLRPLKPFFDITRRDNEMLTRLAQQFDHSNLPPYEHLRPMLVNHPIKDQQNSLVLVNSLNVKEGKEDDMPAFMTRREMPVQEAIEMTRQLVEQMYVNAAINNYDGILEHLQKERVQLTSLVYLLEIIAERKPKNIFEFNIPKEKLSEIMTSNFRELDKVVRQTLLQEIMAIRTELKGEMGDVSRVVEKNMQHFDVFFKDALERILWKVKHDIEATSQEDITRTSLYILNKRAMAYTLGAACYGMYSFMCDDLERRAIQEKFKLDNITEMRKYRETEVSKRLGYKSPAHVNAILKRLARQKLVKLYSDGTFSLSK